MKRRKAVWLTWTGIKDEGQLCQFCGDRNAELAWLEDGGLLVSNVWLHRGCARGFIRQLEVNSDEESAHEFEY